MKNLSEEKKNEYISFLFKMIDGSEEEKVGLAICNSCPLEILEKLSYDESLNVIETVISNDSCTESILKRLFYKSNYFKQMIIEDKKCPLDIINKILNDYNDKLKSVDLVHNNILLTKLAKNIKCTKEIFNKLIDIKLYPITVNLIANESLPIDLLEKIFINQYVNCNETSLDVFFIGNKNCSYKILKEIYKSNENLKDEIEDHPNWKLGEFK